MILPKQEASAFIRGYTGLMLEVLGPEVIDPDRAFYELIAAGRAKYLAEPSRLDSALSALASKSQAVPPAVVAAVRSLEVKSWIYLKDTRAYSVFIDPAGQAAYAVLGLTERFRDILGGSGALVETGLMCYGGRYASDSIVTRVAWLGRNYKGEFADLLDELRTQGRFYRDCTS